MKKLIYIIFCLSIFCCKEKDEDEVVITPIPKLSILKVSPLKGFIGEKIKIEGENFFSDTTLTNVYIGGVKAKIIEITKNYIIAEVPLSNASAFSITVKYRSQEVTFDKSFEVSHPIITSFTPSNGVDTVLITVKGKNLGYDKNNIKFIIHFEDTRSSLNYYDHTIEILELSDTIAIGRINLNMDYGIVVGHIRIITGDYIVTSTSPFYLTQTYVIENKITSPAYFLSLHMSYRNGISENTQIFIGGVPIYVRSTWSNPTYFDRQIICPEILPGKYKIELIDTTGIVILPSDGIDSITVVDGFFSFTPNALFRGGEVNFELPFATAEYCNEYTPIPSPKCDFRPNVTLVDQLTFKEYNIPVPTASSYYLKLKVVISRDIPVGNYKVLVSCPKKIYFFKTKMESDILVLK